MDEIKNEQVRRFMALHRGFDEAFGQYTVSAQPDPETGKYLGERYTKTAPLTEHQYRCHLLGRGPGLGVIPLRADNTCTVGYIDWDIKNSGNPEEMHRRVKHTGVPLVVSRSKSGGAHGALHLTEAMSASDMVRLLKRWTKALGLPEDTEIFPKQDSREHADSIGNWINLPYQNATETMRFALDAKGDFLTEFDDYLGYAESMRRSPAEVAAIKPKAWKPSKELKVLNDTPRVEHDDDTDPWFGAPPCLVTIYKNDGFPEGTRNDGMLAVGVYLKKRFGNNWEEHFGKYNELMCKPALDRSELDELVGSLRKKDYFYRCKQQPIRSACDRPSCANRQFGIGDGRIVITNRASKQVVDDIWRQLRMEPDTPELYKYGLEIARIKDGKLEVLTRDSLWQEIAARFDFGKVDKKRTVDCDPPDSVIKFMRHQPAYETPLPEIHGVTSTPVIMPSGNIHTQPGYSPESKLYHAPSVDVPPVPETPSNEEIARAVSLLRETVCDFPFKHPSDRAHWFAMTILPFVRRVIDGPTPLHVLNKPRRGTGATLLGEVCTMIKSGRALESTTLPNKEEEFHKVIISKLLTTPDFFFIDNTQRVKSDAFAMLLTTSYYEGRRLGVSEMLTLPVTCTFIMTGNNIALGEDFPRRIIDIRLDAEMEKPTEGRVFKHKDLKQWVLAERRWLIWAILTLARAWFAAGQPYTGPVKASYERWSRVIGGILEFAGIEGFLQTPEERSEGDADPMEEEERLLVRYLLARVVARKQQADDLMKAATIYDAAVSADLSLVERYSRPGATTSKTSAVAEFSKNELARIRDKAYSVSSIYDPEKPTLYINVKLERAVKRQDVWLWRLRILNPEDLKGARASDFWDGNIPF